MQRTCTSARLPIMDQRDGISTNEFGMSRSNSARVNGSSGGKSNENGITFGLAPAGGWLILCATASGFRGDDASDTHDRSVATCDRSIVRATRVALRTLSLGVDHDAVEARARVWIVGDFAEVLHLDEGVGIDASRRQYRSCV